jgi:hypothetical protein
VRYREGAEALGGAPPSQEFVTVTVWMTLIIGVVFLVAGIHGRQRWLVFWGALTLVACAVYFFYPQ